MKSDSPPIRATSPAILVVDDDAEMREMLRDHFAAGGYDVTVAGSGAEALAAAQAQPFDVVLTDLRMEGMDGLEMTRRLGQLTPETPIVIMTAFGSIESAIEAIKGGAQNFITKPFKLGSLQVLIDRALEEKRLRDENRRLKREVTERYGFANLIGKSPAMLGLYDLIERVAGASSNLLVIGESGTGKELVARAIHYTGPRSARPFIPINCTSMPENLLESELFGHVKGSFTGAIATKKGLIEAADGGTLFLDEIGDMDLLLQSKLLRVLEDHEVRPVGALTPRKIDVRVIAATHRDLVRAAEREEFRQDLLFRLDVITIRLPPLRDRREDIPLLAAHFLAKNADRLGRALPELTPEALASLAARSWRGNVRELQNVIERAVVLSRGGAIEAADVAGAEEEAVRSASSDLVISGRPTLDEIEERYTDLILREAAGDKSKAAQILGVSSRTLYRRARTR